MIELIIFICTFSVIFLCIWLIKKKYILLSSFQVLSTRLPAWWVHRNRWSFRPTCLFRPCRLTRYLKKAIVHPPHRLLCFVCTFFLQSHTAYVMRYFCCHNFSLVNGLHYQLRPIPCFRPQQKRTILQRNITFLKDNFVFITMSCV